MAQNDKDWKLIENKFREHNFILTKQRRKAVKEILNLEGHNSADDLVSILKRKKIHVSRATLYRLLGILDGLKLVESHNFNTNKKLYERKLGKYHHDHIYCMGCNTIIEFSNPAIEEEQDKILKKFGFIEIYHSHKIFGFCSDCKKQKIL